MPGSGNTGVATQPKRNRLRYHLRRRWAWWALATVLAFGACVRFRQPMPAANLEHDSLEYDTIARNLLAGHGYLGPPTEPFLMATRAARPPLYPLFLASLYRCRWPVTSAQAVFRVVTAQRILDLLTCLLIFLLGRMLYGPAVGLLGALAWARYHRAALYSSSVLPETLAATLCIGFLLAAVCARSKGWAAAALAGLLLGLLAVTKPAILPLALVLVFCWLVARRRDNLRSFVAFLLALTVTLAPWTWRNYRLFGRLVPVSTLGGVNLWIGNYVPFLAEARLESYDIIHKTLLKDVPPDQEGMIDAALYRAAFSDIGTFLTHRPARFLKMEVIKFHRLWSTIGTDADIYHVGLLVLGLVGIAVMAVDWRRAWAPVVFLAGFNVVYVFSYCEARYNLTVMPLAAVAAGLGTCYLLGVRLVRDHVPPNCVPRSSEPGR